MGCGAYSTQRSEEVQISAFLTNRQVDLVKHSWDLVKDEMEETGLRIYSRFLDNEKDLRRYFPKILQNNSKDLEKWEVNEAMLKNHALIVMEGLGAAVESIEDSTCLHAILLSVGEKHYQMRIRPQYLERLWPAIDFGLKEVLQDVYTREVKDAWKQIFMYIITKMKEGMSRARLMDRELSKSHSEEYSHISAR
ncbi:neuroglobin-like [Liolophura sinensis]|uniref:neuroglobin-like n=1 Tax=Liolophura sinensis TaxID=3198878 RepID=UPI003159449B